MSVTSLPTGPTYCEAPGCPGYVVGTDGSLWSCWTAGRWPKRTGTWHRVKATPSNEYGHLRIVMRTEHGYRATEYLHRLVLLTFVGPCPNGMLALHGPDPDPANCELDNLRWGTPQENMDDCERHGRRCKGAAMPTATLTADGVVEVFRLRATGLGMGAIADRLGTSRSVISCVLARLSYTDVPIPADILAAVAGMDNRNTLTADDVRELWRLRAEGWKNAALSERFGVAAWTLLDIWGGRTWKHVRPTEQPAAGAAG
jgi:hypothetical protein